MSLHTTAAWLLLLMLTSMASLRTTVLGYCLCTDTLLIASECCCHDSCQPPGHHDAFATCCSGHDADPAHGEGSAPCPGDIFVAFDHDDFLPPSSRGLDGDRTDTSSTPSPEPPATPSQLLPPLWSLFPTDLLPRHGPSTTPSPPSSQRSRLQSWLI